MSNRTSPVIHRHASIRPVGPDRRVIREVFSFLLAALLAAGLIFATGCGGGGGLSGAQEASENGEVIIALTDAEGDFATYTVDVTGLVLERANGDVVQTLPLNTRVDFAELVELSEFFTIATIPAGFYDSIVVSLDFTNAEIVIQDGADLIEVDSVVDADGNEIGALDVRLKLGERDTIPIVPGVPAHVTLDFDLAASNEIVSTTPTAVVMVEPTLVAFPELESDREHRVRGLLAEVNTETGAVTLNVRPFRHRIGRFGRFTFGTDESTRFDINEEQFIGAEGTEALASHAGENFPVVARGTVINGRLLAHLVVAGSSLPDFDGDFVEGVVAKREGDTLLVRGAILQPSDGTATFRTTVEVLVGDDTQVYSRVIDSGLLTKDSISIGQRVTAVGELVGGVLDATAGKAIMHMNQLTGGVVQANPLAVDLIWLNGRRPDAYDFTGSGIPVPPDATSNDADPEFYEIDTLGLTLGGIEDGDLVRVRGLVNGFGVAPPDFNAMTVIDVSLTDRAADFRVVWLDGTDMPFLSLSSDRLDLDLTEARALLYLAGVPLELTNPVDQLALLPTSDAFGLYAVRTRGSLEIDVFRSFADLVAALSDHLDAGEKLVRIDASGSYTSDEQLLTGRRMAFHFLPATTVE
jgi:hypothetical protein